jgi:hypothetical protein
MNDGSAEAWMHKALCLEAEVSSRSAAQDHMRGEIDVLEEGLRQAKMEIDRLKSLLRVRYGSETATDSLPSRFLPTNQNDTTT